MVKDLDDKTPIYYRACNICGIAFATFIKDKYTCTDCMSERDEYGFVSYTR